MLAQTRIQLCGKFDKRVDQSLIDAPTSKVDQQFDKVLNDARAQYLSNCLTDAWYKVAKFCGQTFEQSFELSCYARVPKS